MKLPRFVGDGVLPPGDFELSISELKLSMLVGGPEIRTENLHWDKSWRMKLVENLEIMVRQLNQVGISEIFVDGSFVEDKDHPNDIDGYFVCDRRHLISGDLERELYPHFGQSGSGITDQFGNELDFPSAFRISRRNDSPKGIIRIGGLS